MRAENLSMDLSSLSPNVGARHRKKRLGMGEGSGKGKTCGKGQKGQNSRSGGGVKAGFEGGQMPLHRRLPKVGFVSRKKVTNQNLYKLLSVGQLSKFDLSGTVSIEDLKKRVISTGKVNKVKLLAGGGEVLESIDISVHAASKAAVKAIEEAGGTVTILDN